MTQREQLKAAEDWRGHVTTLVERYGSAEAGVQAGIVAIVEEDWGDAAGEALVAGFEAVREQKVNGLRQEMTAPAVAPPSGGGAAAFERRPSRGVYRREEARRVIAPAVDPEPVAQPEVAAAPVEGSPVERAPEPNLPVSVQRLL